MHEHMCIRISEKSVKGHLESYVLYKEVTALVTLDLPTLIGIPKISQGAISEGVKLDCCAVSFLWCSES